MKSVFNLLLVIFYSTAHAWGAPDLAPASDRQKVYQFKTKYDKKTGFGKLSIWSAKTFSNSAESIKLRDSDLGVLVVKGNIKCDPYKLGSGHGENPHMEMTVEIALDNKKADVKVTDLLGRSLGSYDDASRPSNKEEIDKGFKECVDPFVEAIKAELS